MKQKRHQMQKMEVRDVVQEELLHPLGQSRLHRVRAKSPALRLPLDANLLQRQREKPTTRLRLLPRKRRKYLAKKEPSNPKAANSWLLPQLPQIDEMSLRSHRQYPQNGRIAVILLDRLGFPHSMMALDKVSLTSLRHTLHLRGQTQPFRSTSMSCSNHFLARNVLGPHHHPSTLMHNRIVVMCNK